MNKVKFVLFSAGILLALAFSFGCSSSDDEGGGSDSLNINPQVYEDDGSYIDDDDIIHYKFKAYKGSGDISMDVYHCDTLINAGSVTGGIAKLELPKNIPEEYLENPSEGEGFFSLDGIFRRCTPYPEGFKYWRDVFELTDNNGKQIGYLGLDFRYEDEQIAYDNEMIEGEWVRYVYFSKNVKITCKQEPEDYKPYKPYIYLINIDAKKGWNIVYNTRYYDSKGIKYELSTNSNILKKEKEIKWFFSPYYE